MTTSEASSLDYHKNTCLLLDTSNSWNLLGVYARGQYFSHSLEEQRQTLTLLPEAILKVLSLAKIKRPDYIIAATGPGSFTGLRLGISFARNLSQLWDIPVLGLPSLFFYGYDLLQKDAFAHTQRIGLMLDAKRRQVYCAWCLRHFYSSYFGTAESLEALQLLKSLKIEDKSPAVFIKDAPHLNSDSKTCPIPLISNAPASTILSYIQDQEAPNSSGQTGGIDPDIYTFSTMQAPNIQSLHKLAEPLLRNMQEDAAHWELLQAFYLRQAVKSKNQDMGTEPT